jgi:hypothetical protein
VTQGFSEIRWLLALEATLFFSVPVWVPCAWGRPATYPIQFALVLFAVASVCTLLFHVAPACFACRRAATKSPMSWALVPLAVGYVVYSIRLLLTMQRTLVNFVPSRIALPVLLLSVAAIGFVRSWWKVGAVLMLLIGVGVSIYMLATPWRGIGVVNGAFAREPSQDSVYFAEGLIFATAPAFAIAARIGSLEPRLGRIWLSAGVGFFFPLCLSVSVTALMAQAGENLFWRPSLFLEFIWALEGPGGGHAPWAWHAIEVVVASTFIGPTLVGCLSVRLLAGGFGRARKIMLGAGAAAAVAWVLLTHATLALYPPYDLVVVLWTELIAAFGIASGLGCLFRKREERSADRATSRSPLPGSSAVKS